MKVGILTFHNSYNCGSMLEAYAIYKYLKNKNLQTEIINFSNRGQKELYTIKSKNDSLKHILKNIILSPHYKKLEFNNNKYEEFKNKNLKLSEQYDKSDNINEKDYDVVVAGSDQVWNITIKDADDAYFLNWVKKAKKVAYAPSFGARKIANYTKEVEKYIEYLKDFDALSVREKNGQKWIKEMINKEVPVLIDPTLLLNSSEYDNILDNQYETPNTKYIFFYCPQFNTEICKFVKKISKKYRLPVIVWSTKSYYLKGIYRYGFKLPEYESPAVYLKLIKNAELIITTSFHGSIFSTIYKKKFFVIKNGEMYGDDDRVKTLLDSIKMNNRLIEYKFDDKYDYLKEIDYSTYDENLIKLKEKAEKYIDDNICK